jgi:uncharacterized coiled-coil DUF342 family protein
MIDWKNMSNMEIRQKMDSMKYEYESLKNKISDIITQMDNLDNEYNKANKEIENRSKK